MGWRLPQISDRSWQCGMRRTVGHQWQQLPQKLPRARGALCLPSAVLGQRRSVAAVNTTVGCVLSTGLSSLDHSQGCLLFLVSPLVKGFLSDPNRANGVFSRGRAMLSNG